MTLSAGGSAQAAFSDTPDAGIPAVNGAVHAIAISATKVFIGGQFTTVGGLARTNIAAIDRATGDVDAAFDPNIAGGVFALAVSGPTVFVGGEFGGVDGTEPPVIRRGIAQLDGATGTPTAFNPQLDGDVYALAVSGSTVYAGGTFLNVGAGDEAAPGTLVPRSHMAQLNAGTGIATAFDPELSGTVYALAVSGGTVFAGGAFGIVGAGDGATSPVARSDLAQLNAATGTATAFDSGIDGDVYALAVSGSTVYAGGQFSTVGAGDGASVPATRLRLAQLNAASGTATGFDPQIDGPVTALAVTGSTVYAAGHFDHVGAGDGVTMPAARSRIAQLDATTGVAGPFAPMIADGTDSAADSPALALDGPGRLYVGCKCESVGGQASSFARFTDPAVGTAVHWRGGSARVTRAGVRVVWRTGFEADNLGFDLLRVRRGAKARVKVTHRPVAGGALTNARGLYHFVDRHGRRGDRYYVIDRDLSGHATVHAIGAAR